MRLFNSTVFTNQGASDDGWHPEASELPVAAAIFELREAIYAFPNGCTRDEFRQWVKKMHEVMQSAITRARVITDGKASLGIRFVPWFVYRFKQLYEKYTSDSVSFDLRAILILEPLECTEPISNQSFRMCPDKEDFHLNLQWMSDLVDQWNTTRMSKGWPLLTLDDAPYEGRFLGLPGSIVRLEDGRVPLHRPIWPEKEPVDDPVVQPVNDSAAAPGQLLTSVNKGKGVDRSAHSSFETEKTKRERPFDASVGTADSLDVDVIEISSSEEPCPSHTHARRSTRHKTHSKDRVPHVVSAPPAKVRPRPRKRVKKDDALDLIPDVETHAPPPLPIVSGSGADSSSTVDDEGSDSREITVVFGDVILGGVRMTKGGVYLVPPDSQRERSPCRLILNCGSAMLWLGTILLPYIFWAHIPNDPNLDALQQALFPCLVCLIFGFPCYHELGVAVGCIRCKYLKIHCSHSSRIESSSIPNPYNRLLARYMLSWQIYNLKKGRALAAIYPNYGGYNFMPGVRRGYMPGHRNGNQQVNRATISARYTKISGKLEWDEFWVGENYVEARKIWDKYLEEPADTDARNEILSRSPPIGTLLPSDIQAVLNEYYEEIRTVDPLFTTEPPTDDDDVTDPTDNTTNLTDDTTLPTNDTAMCTDDTASSTDDTASSTDDATMSIVDATMPVDSAPSPTDSSALSSIDAETPTSAGSDTPKPAMRTTPTPLYATPTPSASFAPPNANVIPSPTVDAIAVDTEMYSPDDATTPPTIDVAMPMVADLLPSSTSAAVPSSTSAAVPSSTSAAVPSSTSVAVPSSPSAAVPSLTPAAVPSSDVNVALPPAPDAALVADTSTTTSVDSITLPSVKPITPIAITAVPPVVTETIGFTHANFKSTSLPSYDAVPFSSLNTITPILTNIMSTVDTATTSLAPMIVQEPLASTSRAPPPITQSTDVPELNVPQLVKEQLKLSSGSEMDNSGHAEGRLDDGEGRREGYGPSSTSDNVAESDVTMTGGHSLLSQTQDGLNISMLIDEHFPTPSTSSNSGDVDMQGWQGPSLGHAQSSPHHLLPSAGLASGPQDRLHMTSPLLSSYSNHASGPIFAHVDLPDPMTWKDNVTDRNLSLINGQLIDLQPGYPIGHQQPAPTPSISEGLTDISSNTSPLPSFVPIMAEEFRDFKTLFCQALSRIETLEVQHRETGAKLAAAEQALIASKAQIDLLSSQAVTRNEDVLRRMDHRLDEETSVIRNAIFSSVGQAFRSFVQAHSGARASSSPFDNDAIPPTTSLPQQDSHRTYTRQSEPLAESIFTSFLTDPVPALTSNPVSPIAPHHSTNNSAPAISGSIQGAGPSRSN